MELPAPIAPPLRLTGLLLTGATVDGPLLAAGVGLETDDVGITVLDVSGEAVRHWPWERVRSLRADDHAPGPDGSDLQVLAVDVEGRLHRFLAPAPALSPLMARRPPPPAPGAPRGRWGRRLVARGGDVAGASRRARAATTVGLVLAVGLAATVSVLGSSPARPSATPAAPGAGGMGRVAAHFGSRAVTPLELPPATTPPAPAPPSVADAPALASHEVFGFAPYWSLPTESSIDVTDLSTLDYFSLDVNGDATIDESGSGWVGYQSQALADLITRAHGAGDRVVLTITCFDQSALDQLAADPTAGTQLGSEVVGLLEAKNLDGVNVDFEGQGSADRSGMDRLMAQLSAAVHGTDSHWQVTMDTYASAAGDSSGFYDIAGLAPSVDSFFIMAYDMENPAEPSPNAALSAGPGFTDLQAIEQYAAVVPVAKLILGVPYYGYDWPTTGPGLGDPATGPPTPLSYAQIAASGHPVYWDATSDTAWTSYQVNGQWHQTWFDDPTSLSMKADLAAWFHLRGVGMWALGMDGYDPTMLAALLGHAPAAKDYQAGPGPTGATVPTTTSPANPAFSYTGVWQGSPVQLMLADPSVPAPAAGAPVGTLTGFTSNNPAYVCLEAGLPLTVAPSATSPGVWIVTAVAPTDCTSATFEFGSSLAPAGTPAPTVPTTTRPAPTTTTTAPTTTTTAPTTTTTAPTTTTTTVGSDDSVSPADSSSP